MPTLRLKSDPIVAVCLSDVHMSLRPPLARSEEKSWIEAQSRVWEEVRGLVTQHNAMTIIAGDLFDRWNAPAELINLAMTLLPPSNVYGIPGNHDLPNHRMDLISKSAWWTLVHSGHIIPLGPTPVVWGDVDRPMALYGRPFGGKTPRPKFDGGFQLYTHILVTHEFVYTSRTGYEGAPSSGKLHHRGKDFSRFDAVIVGDNHMGFHRVVEETHVFNCGTLLRRKSNEVRYHPQVGLLHRSGMVSPFWLDTTKDVFTKTSHMENEAEDIWGDSVDHFMIELEKAADNVLDFRETIKLAIEKASTRKQVKEIIAEAMDE